MTDTTDTPKLTKPRSQREREAAADTAVPAADGKPWLDGVAAFPNGDLIEADQAGELTDEQYAYVTTHGIDTSRILEWFGGKPVTGVILEVANAGAGLEEGLAVAPILHALGSRASINLDGHHNRISYKEFPKRDAELIRVERFYTESGLYVDEKLAAKPRRELRKLLDAHRAENGGTQELPGIADAEAAAEE